MPLPQWFGTLPSWLSALGIAGIFAAVLKYRLGMRQLENADEGDIRDHYAEEVKALRTKLDAQEEHFRNIEKHWRSMMDASDQRHEECEAARRALRAELEEMHRERREDRALIGKMTDEIEGLKRQISQYSSEQLVRLEKEGAPISAAALSAAKRIIEKYGDSGSGGK